MAVLKTHALPVRTESDIVHVRQTVRTWSVEIKFSLVDQTKIVTAASELARNLLIYGGGGEVRLAILQDRASGAGCASCSKTTAPASRTLPRP